jgi:phospholipase C
MPLLVISPFAKSNYVDHTTTDQASITRFIEDNWGTGRIGDASFDVKAGSLENMLDFHREGDTRGLFLDPASGQPISNGGHESRVRAHRKGHHAVTRR